MKTTKIICSLNLADAIIVDSKSDTNVTSPARNIIMPAYYPSQISLTAAFSEYEIQKPVLWSLSYGALLLLLGIGVFRWRMQRE